MMPETPGFGAIGPSLPPGAIDPSTERFEVPSTFEAAGDLAETIGGLCRAAAASMNRDSEVSDAVHLAVAEALNNVVEHAYAGMEDQTVIAQISFCDGMFQVTLVDHGRQMPDGTLPETDADFDPLDIDSLPEGGFGWMLIRSQMDTVSYERRNGTNVLSMAKSL